MINGISQHSPLAVLVDYRDQIKQAIVERTSPDLEQLRLRRDKLLLERKSNLAALQTRASYEAVLRDLEEKHGEG